MTRDRLASAAMGFVGAPSRRYSDPERERNPIAGFYCSDFVIFVCRLIGMQIPQGVRHANELFDQFGVLVHLEMRQRGDLVFFSRNGLLPTHVGILVHPYAYVHAPGKDGTVVTIEELKFEKISGYGLRPEALYIENPIGFKRPSIRNGRYQKIL